MEQIEYARFAYLALLLIAVGWWAMAEFRGRLGSALRQFTAWILIIIGLVGAYGLWGDIRNDILPRQSVVSSGVIEVPLSQDGHFHLSIRMNGVPVKFTVDTGATDIVLTREDAAKIGLDADKLAFNRNAITANGSVKTARASVSEMRLGDIVDRDVSVSVNDASMQDSLLGMAYLRKFEKIEITGNTMILTR